MLFNEQKTSKFLILNSCYRAIVLSCYRAFVLSCFCAFVPSCLRAIVVFGAYSFIE